MAEENTPKDTEQQETPPSNGSEADSTRAAGIHPDPTVGQPPTAQQAATQADAASDEDSQPDASAKPAAGGKAPASKKPPAAKEGKPPKKEKPPAVEDKPFQEFMKQDFLPALQSAFKDQGVDDVELEFERRKLEVIGSEQSALYWQVIGSWNKGRRQFYLAFLKEDISGPKVFSYSDEGTKPSTLESFMIDERKVTLDLMLHYVMQRLNAQKWLVRN